MQGKRLELLELNGKRFALTKCRFGLHLENETRATWRHALATGVAASATAAMAVSSIPFSVVVADLDLVRCLLLAVWTVVDCLFNR